MPSLEGWHDGRRLYADILVLDSVGGPSHVSVPAKALIDTGATCSGIGPAIVRQLGLRSHGKKPLGSATEERLMPFYIFKIGIPQSVETTTGPAQSTLPFVFNDCDGFSWSMDREFDVILGMDILAQCRLEMDRSRWKLSFGGF